MEIIQNNDWVLSIDLNGGRINELKYKNEVILGTFKRIDGKTGNTHICCPNFGNEGMEKFGLPFHGPFRNLEWKLSFKDKTKLEIEIESLDLNIKQVFDIWNDFKQIVKIKNLSNKSRTVNIAIHNYWDANNSWQRTRLNGEKIDKLIKSDSCRTLAKENVLEITNKMKYKWSLSGFKYGQFWTSFISSNKNKEYDQNYVCIEPSLEKQGFFDEEKSNLSSFESLEFGQKIQPLIE